MNFSYYTQTRLRGNRMSNKIVSVLSVVMDENYVGRTGIPPYSFPKSP